MASYPSIPGMWPSISTRSYDWRATASSASAPVPDDVRAVAQPLEQADSHPLVHGVVLGHEDPRAARGARLGQRVPGDERSPGRGAGGLGAGDVRETVVQRGLPERLGEKRREPGLLGGSRLPARADGGDQDQPGRRDGVGPP